MSPDLLHLTLPHLLGFLPALVLGALLGFFGGLFGIGGGIIAIPLLVIGYGMEQPLAQGTALVMMVPNLLVGWWRYSQRHPVPVGRALAIGLTAVTTTWGVAHLANGLAPATLKVLFSLFLGALAVHMLAGRKPREEQPSPRLPARLMPLVGVVGGSSMGLLGIGGGLLATPLFAGWFGQRQTIAQSLSLALVAPSSIIALLSYANAGRVDLGNGLAPGPERAAYRFRRGLAGAPPAGTQAAPVLQLDAAGHRRLAAARAALALNRPSTPTLPGAFSRHLRAKWSCTSQVRQA